MTIHSGPKVSVTCPNCKVLLRADRPSDIHCVLCNSEDQYYIECPICGGKIEITEADIPSLFKPYIRKLGCGIMTYHE